MPLAFSPDNGGSTGTRYWRQGVGVSTLGRYSTGGRAGLAAWDLALWPARDRLLGPIYMLIPWSLSRESAGFWWTHPTA